jgi:hypothetical protein
MAGHPTYDSPVEHGSGDSAPSDTPLAMRIDPVILLDG